MKGPPLVALTEAEEQLLRIVLREVRGAMKTAQQLQITIDPWYTRAGCNLFFGYNGAGWSTTIEGPIRQRTARRGRTR